MKIVLFGGGGFIGSTIADRLLVDGHELRIFERPRVPPYRKFTELEKVEWVTGDLSSTHDVGDAVSGPYGLATLKVIALIPYKCEYICRYFSIASLVICL
jgi:uncharacterized protein YbjT (DUF2867 family)